MSSATHMKKQLAAESLLALATFHSTGRRPSVDRVPLLMCVWRDARDALVTDGHERSRWAHTFGPMKFDVASTWDAQGALNRFWLRDRTNGVLLLVGDGEGPVFTVPGGLR